MSKNIQQPSHPRVKEFMSLMESANQQDATAAAINRLSDEIAELRAALVGYQGKIAVGADVMDEFRRLSADGDNKC